MSTLKAGMPVRPTCNKKPMKLIIALTSTGRQIVQEDKRPTFLKKEGFITYAQNFSRLAYAFDACTV